MIENICFSLNIPWLLTKIIVFFKIIAIPVVTALSAIFYKEISAWLNDGYFIIKKNTFDIRFFNKTEDAQYLEPIISIRNNLKKKYFSIYSIVIVIDYYKKQLEKNASMDIKDWSISDKNGQKIELPFVLNANEIYLLKYFYKNPQLAESTSKLSLFPNIEITNIKLEIQLENKLFIYKIDNLNKAQFIRKPNEIFLIEKK